MTTATAPQQFVFVSANDIVVGGTYHYQGRAVTITDVIIPGGTHGFAEITYISPLGGQRVNKTPKNRETDFSIGF